MPRTKFDWGSPRKDHTLASFPNPNARFKSHIRSSLKVPSEIQGLTRHVLRIDETTGAPVVEYLPDPVLASIGARWMALRLLFSYKGREHTSDRDIEMLELIVKQSNDHATSDWLLTWYGAALCFSRGDAADQLDEFVFWKEAGCPDHVVLHRPFSPFKHNSSQKGVRAR